jgi:hypothetical protein
MAWGSKALSACCVSICHDPHLPISPATRGENLLLGERSSFLPQYPSAPLNTYVWSVRLSYFRIWAPINPQHASAAAHARIRMKPRWSDSYPACSGEHVCQIDGVVVNWPLK